MHYRQEMRSHSKARSLPASLLQFVIFISFSNVLVPTGFIPAGQKNNDNNTQDNVYDAVNMTVSSREFTWFI